MEDLTTYVEVDPASKVTKTSTRVTGTEVPMNNDTYLYKDFGASFFDKIDVYFTLRCTYSYGFSCMTGFANNVNDSYQWTAPYIAVYYLNNVLTIYDGSSSDSSVTLSLNTDYYCKLYRVAGNSTVTLYIYSDASRTILVDTISCTGIGTIKYRYFYPLANYNVGYSPGFGYYWSGYVENIQFLTQCRACAQLIGYMG